MTFGDLLLIILAAVILYVVLEVSIAVLIIAIIIVVIWYLVTLPAKLINENRQVDYFTTYANPHLANNIWPGFPEDSHMGYGNYWYLNQRPMPNRSCQVPNSISEYCVNQRLGQGEPLINSIRNCSLPMKQGPQCIADNEYFERLYS